MTSRSLLIVLPIALAGIGAGAVCALWTAHDNALPPAIATHQSAPSDSTAATTANRPLHLRLDERLDRSGKTPAKPRHEAQSRKEYAAQKHAGKEQRSAAPASASKPERPLDLKLPSDGQDILTQSDTDTPEDTRLPNSDVALSGKTFDFKPAPAVTPDVEALDLFNPSNGLRGFMKQGWVNQSFAVQGGLALNDERVTPDDNSLRDDIGIGMGVIFAF